MISTLHTFLQMDGRYFVNERTHEKILAIQNRLNGKECIQYEGKKDIIVGDILTIPDTNERFQITRLKSSVDLFDKSILWECKIVCVNRYCMNLLYAPYWGKQR